MMEKKAKKSAELMAAAVSHPLLPGPARVALLDLAATVEALAHEVEVLKIRLSEFEPEAEFEDDDPRSMGCVDDKGRP